MIQDCNERDGAQDEEKQNSPSSSPIPDHKSIGSLFSEEKDPVPSL
jgi:hypothetical protein